MKIIKAIAVGNVTITVLQNEDSYYINAMGETLPKIFTANEVIVYLMNVIEGEDG